MAKSPQKKQPPKTDNQQSSGNRIRIKRYLQSLKGAYSDNTIRALSSDIVHFDDWCITKGVVSVPPSSETLVRYIESIAGRYTLATVRRKIASISHMLKAFDEADETKSTLVSRAIRRVGRKQGARQKQAGAISEADVKAILKRTGSRLIDHRDRALLLTARDMLARRCELVNLMFEDLDVHNENSATILVRKSKTDPEGEGVVIWLSPQTVKAISQWLEESGVDEGYLFRSVSKSGHVGYRLSDRDVSRRFKVMASRAGIDPTNISGHSCRVGMAQDLVTAGAALAELMIAGRWKSPLMPTRYAERITAERGAVAKYMGERERNYS